MGTLFSGLSKVFPSNPLMQQVGATQAILESGLMGKPSKLATDFKNLFGIKGSGTAGSAALGTKEFQGGKMTPTTSSFGSYNTFQDSINQYANLMGKPRYSGVMSAQSPEQAFDALQKAGYATDPNYRAKLMSIYRRYVAPKFAGSV
jgi:lysozyme